MPTPLQPLNPFHRQARRGLLALLLHALPLAGWGYVSWLTTEDLQAETPPAAAAMPADRVAVPAPTPVTQAPEPPSRRQTGERHALPG